MQKIARIVPCPRCGQAARLSLHRHRVDGTERDDVLFECRDTTHTLTEAERIRLWAAAQQRRLAAG